MSSALHVPDVDQWSLRTEGALGTGFSAPRGVKDLLRQRRGSSGEGKRPTTSSSQPVTPPIMPGDEDRRSVGRGSQKRAERLSAPARPELYELEPEPEPSLVTDREREEREEREERRRRRRRKKHAKQHAHDGGSEEVASRGPSSDSRTPSRQRTPEYPLAPQDKQSPRARKAAEKAAQKAGLKGGDSRTSDEARARRRERMHKNRKGDSRSSSRRDRRPEAHATPAESTATKSVEANSAQIRLLIETDSTQTDDDLLQELLRRRRAYLNEQSQLDGRESDSVVKAHEEADQIFAQAAQRAREEAMKTVDASTCLKAALWNGSQDQGQQKAQHETAMSQPQVPRAADLAPVLQNQSQIEVELPERATSDAYRANAVNLADAAKQVDDTPAPPRKNTRGFRLRR